MHCVQQSLTLPASQWRRSTGLSYQGVPLAALQGSGMLVASADPQCAQPGSGHLLVGLATQGTAVSLSHACMRDMMSTPHAKAGIG
jgi:hypothetical protein